MRKVIVLMHVSLDGFVAGPNGEMDWICFDDEIAGYVDTVVATADMAIYGRVTYQMMENYWPDASKDPAATRHDVDHANWVNNVEKIVISKSLEKTEWNNSRLLKNNIPEEIIRLKQLPGKNMIIIGSASVVHYFMQEGLIDEYWLNINPIVLGSGKPFAKDISEKLDLKLVNARPFGCGVVGFHYQT